MPAFIGEDIFKTIIPREKAAKSSEKILRLLKENNGRISRKNIQNLKDEGLLEGIGADKGGYWKAAEL